MVPGDDGTAADAEGPCGIGDTSQSRWAQPCVGGLPDKSVRVWDVSTGQVLATLDGHTGPVHAVAFSPDGKVLASGGGDKTIRLWDVTADKPLLVLEGSTARRELGGVQSRNGKTRWFQAEQTTRFVFGTWPRARVQRHWRGMDAR